MELPSLYDPNNLKLQPEKTERKSPIMKTLKIITTILVLIFSVVMMARNTGLPFFQPQNSKQIVAEQWTTYQNKNNEYKIEYPQNWYKYELDHSTIFTSYNKNNPGYKDNNEEIVPKSEFKMEIVSPYIYITYEKESVLFEDLYAGSYWPLKADGAKFEKIKEEAGFKIYKNDNWHNTYTVFDYFSFKKMSQPAFVIWNTKTGEVMILIISDVSGNYQKITDRIVSSFNNL